MPEDLLLLPYPQQLKLNETTCRLVDHRLILLKGDQPGQMRSIAGRLESFLRARLGFRWEMTASAAVPAHQVALTLEVDPVLVEHSQGYRLEILPSGTLLSGHDLAGLYYGICTLIQLIDSQGEVLPGLSIVDWPDFPVRGVMLDVSRDKVPTTENLQALIDLLSSWKINQIQLYTEHTFAYRNHPEVWADASPLTGEEILELDAYCRERYIELVPNQNSFGHMNRWLNHRRYKPLAEVEDGYEMPWGRQEGSFSLCPTDPASLDLIRELYDELLPHFSSSLFNVGCDETYDVGQGRSRQAVDQLGAGRVYLNFLLQVYAEVKAHGRTMMFWSDILQNHPELIPDLPKDLIALEWGYEADFPFDQHCQRLSEAGISFYVCPGTSTWCSLTGRTDNARQNLLNAAENGLKWGASGYLITDWGDNGHWQSLPVSYLGFAAGAAYSWALDANRAIDLANAVSLFAFRDRSGAMGRVAYDLGNIYLAYPVVWPSSSILQGILERDPEKIRRLKGINSEGFYTVLEAIDQAILPLQVGLMERPDRELIGREFRLAARMARHACRRGLLALESDPGNAAELCHFLNADLQELMAEYCEVWLARNRPGGLSDSLARLEKVRRMYREMTAGATTLPA